MSVSHNVNRPYHQRGAALVVGLIMLLLLTLIGVAGMKDTLLQEKMAGNARDREIALQAAESALRAAEVRLGALTAPAMTNNSGLYDMTLSTDTRRTASEVAFWSQWGWAAGDSVEYPRTLAGVAEGNPPRYVIEKLDVLLSSRSGYTGGGCTGVCAEDSFDPIKSADVSDYRVTARGVGSTLDAVVILQSTFRRDSE